MLKVFCYVLFIRYTSKKSNIGRKDVYAILLNWPKGDTLTLGAPVTTSQTTVTLLGYKGDPFKWAAHSGGGIDITFPAIPENKMPCEWAWVLKLENLSNIRNKHVNFTKHIKKQNVHVNFT